MGSYSCNSLVNHQGWCNRVGSSRVLAVQKWRRAGSNPNGGKAGVCYSCLASSTFKALLERLQHDCKPQHYVLTFQTERLYDLLKATEGTGWAVIRTKMFPALKPHLPKGKPCVCWVSAEGWCGARRPKWLILRSALTGKPLWAASWRAEHPAQRYGRSAVLPEHP